MATKPWAEPEPRVPVVPLIPTDGYGEPALLPLAVTVGPPELPADGPGSGGGLVASGTWRVSVPDPVVTATLATSLSLGHYSPRTSRRWPWP